MAPAPPPVGGLPESKLRASSQVPIRRNLVALSPSYVSLDQNRGAQMVKDREKERARNETPTADATANATTGATIRRKRAATTSTAPPPGLGYIFSGPPGPLPSVYGSILSSGRN